MHNYRKSAGALLVLFVISVSGCRRPEDTFVGRYQGVIQPSDAVKSQMGKLPKDLATKLADQIRGINFDLNLRKDMSYTVAATIPSSGGETATGLWSLADKKLTLSEKEITVNGKSSPSTAPPQILVPGPNPRVLVADMNSMPDAKALGNLVFTKVD